MLSPWIICTLTLQPLLAFLVPRNFHRCIKLTITLLKTATIPTYYGIFIVILRYIAMQLSTVLFVMTRFIIVIFALHDHVVDIVFEAKPLRESWIRGCPDGRTMTFGRTPGL